MFSTHLTHFNALNVLEQDFQRTNALSVLEVCLGKLDKNHNHSEVNSQK